MPGQGSFFHLREYSIWILPEFTITARTAFIRGEEASRSRSFNHKGWNASCPENRNAEATRVLGES
jgi:hypothetical protein